MSLNKIALLFVSLSFISTPAIAERSTVSYDISGGSGTRDGTSFSEIHLGLNWFVLDHLNWRNSIFTRFGDRINTIYGLDSAALFNTDFYNSDKSLGVEFYAGPGVRVASENSNALFGKAGVTLALGGIRLGVGMQALYYLETRRETDGTTLPENEMQTFIIISGSGSF